MLVILHGRTNARNVAARIHVNTTLIHTKIATTATPHTAVASVSRFIELARIISAICVRIAALLLVTRHPR